MSKFLSVVCDICHFCLLMSRLYFLCIMIGKYFYLIDYKYFNLNAEQWETNYQTFPFTVSYAAVHNSTKDCAFPVLGTLFVLWWNYPRCTVVVIEAYGSHAGNLTLVECSISPDETWLPWRGYSTRRAAKSLVTCWTLMLMNYALF